jgi:hypothetical protein
MMVNEIDNLLSDLLQSWHKWASGYQHVGGINTSPMFRGGKPNKTRDDDDGVDGALHNSTMEAIDAQVMDMIDIHRTAILIQARNLVAGVSVWRSPRLPVDPVERHIVLLEARNALLRRLIAAGVI